MNNNDVMTRNEIRAKIQQAINDGDKESFSNAFNDMMLCISNEIQQRADERISEKMQEADAHVLASRGVRQLTSKEKEYYQKFADAARSANPKQALMNADLTLPITVMNAVFDELQTSHPLLSAIDFTNTTGITEMIMSENGEQMAQWGKLCDEVVKELLAGFTSVNMTLLKLSAFIPVCKAMLDLGPEWLDDFVRQVLYEALANGLEYGIVTGTGNDMPIGMDRQVGEGVTVTGNVYPEKSPVAVTDLSPATVGNLLSLLAVDPAGKPRTLRDVIMVVNPQDYYQKVMPATTVMAPDGTYRNDVLPYPMRVIQSMALPRGKAILGLAYKYFAGAGMAREGRIEYSDHYQFLEDDRVYLIKLYANGFPMDNNAFLVLDVSGLRPATLQVTTLDAPAASTNSNLASLRLGRLALSPAFSASEDTYTANTTDATNTINAVPADAGASISITNTHDTDEVDNYDNGDAITWATGSNTVAVKVTAANGTATQTYTVTVTKA
nr:MAG TPA: major capsid protein [Caudoviricetes sp.]